MVRLFRCLLLSLLLALPAVSVLAVEAHHHHGQGEEAPPASLHLDNGRKWATDAPLRQGMERIRDLMLARLQSIHGNKLAPADYRTLAGQVEKEVGAMVAACKLPEAADAMLHLLIADLGAGSDAMAGRRGDMSPRRGAAKVMGALENYGRYFDHPGWQSLAH